MRFLVRKSNIDGILANMIVEFRDATLFVNVFPMKSRIPHGTSDDDLSHTSFILDHVKMMTNIGEILLVDLLLISV